MPSRLSKNNQALVVVARHFLVTVCLAQRLGAQMAPSVANDSSPAVRPVVDSLGIPRPARDTTTPSPGQSKFEFSGILFANFQYRLISESDRGANRFDVERAYLTFRARPAEKTTVRITADLFQQTNEGRDSYYKGWTLRAKYAYLQQEFSDRAGWRPLARVGLLHNVIIDHDERFWPRWIGTAAAEAAGFFSSADAGVAAFGLLPRKLGEVYMTVTNGPGYTSRETDRFKDYALRLTLSPRAAYGSSLYLSAWGYKGAVGSAFSAGGPGQTGTIGGALRRNRFGVHAAAAHRDATFAVQYAVRQDGGEKGENTAASPRVVSDSTGRLASAYAIVRPFAFMSGGSTPLSLLARFDRVTSNRATGLHHDMFVAGLIWDFSTAAAISADYQRLRPADPNPLPPAKTFFVHFVARF